MSLINNNISELLTKFESDDLSNLIYDSPQLYSKNYKKINVFNKNIKKPMKKIWIRTPQLKIIKQSTLINTKHKLSIPLFVAINAFDKQCKKFLSFIKKVEQIVGAHITNTHDDVKIRSSLKKTNPLPSIMTLWMPYKKNNNDTEFSFQIFDGYNKKINLKTIENNYYVSAFIELTDVWINETEFGFNWNILQMKLYPEFDFTQCLFSDEVSESDNNLIPEAPIFLPTNTYQVKQTKTINNTNCTKTEKVNTIFAPSVKDLLSVKLKPIKKSS